MRSVLRRLSVGAVVLVLAAATAMGMLSRIYVEGPYFLLTQTVAAHPMVAVLLFVVSLVAYAVVISGLSRWLPTWAREGPDPSDRGRWELRVDWAYARWYRLSLVLAVAWLPWIVLSFPGQPNPDFARMIGEFLLTRSEFPADVTPPYEAYPTPYYLLDDSERIWSNHHPFFLMLYYGQVSSLSLSWFGSYLPGIVFLSAVSLGFTLLALGRAFELVGRLVPSWRVRAVALVIVAASPLIALWGMSQTKNHLFAAAFVWLLALVARLVHEPESVRWGWWLESVGVSFVLAASVVFGWSVLLVTAIAAAIAVSARRWRPLVAWGIPAMIVYGSIAWAISAHHVIPSDPIESKGISLQVLALVAREHPEAISSEDRAALSKIFDLEAMAASFDPDLSDPVKSTGPYATKSASFKYQTVQPEDWDDFTSILVRVAAAEPATAVDALVLSTYRYVDPLDRGTNWYPPWNRGYQREVAGYSLSPLGFNDVPRQIAKGAAYGCYEFLPCRPLLSHSTKTVAVVVLCAAAIAARRRYAWLWAAPFVLQLGIVAASPLSAGGRYALGFTYALGLLVLLLAIRDEPGRIRPDTRGS